MDEEYPFTSPDQRPIFPEYPFEDDISILSQRTPIKDLGQMSLRELKQYNNFDIIAYEAPLEEENLLRINKKSYSPIEEFSRNERFDSYIPESISGKESLFVDSRIINIESKYFGEKINDFKSNVRTRPAPPSLFELERQTKTRERMAHKFRSARLRLGDLGLLTRQMQEGALSVYKPYVSAIVRRSNRLLQKTQGENEMHRAYAPLIAGIMSEPELRREFMGRLDETATNESAKLKEAAEVAPLQADVLVIGSGVQAAIFTAKLRAEKPEANVLSVDKADKLGGQFRAYGPRPVFSINSRNFREQDTEIDGVPSADGNLNSFGVKAPLQITDFTYETYPTNTDLGDTAAINQHLSSPTILGVELVRVIKNRLNEQDYEAIVRDVHTGQIYTVITKNIIVTTGLGSREQFARPEEGNIWSAERVLSHFGNKDELFPMDAFENKKVAIVGGGDTGRVIAELMCRLGPKEAYGKSSVQLGGSASRIDWYGTEFSNQEDFIRTNRSRYQRLASFIKAARKRATVGTIYPNNLRVLDIQQDSDEVEITDSNGDLKKYDVVIDCTQLVNESLVPFKDIVGSVLPLGVPQYITGRGTIEIGKRLSGQNIYLAGPAAKTTLSAAETSTFAAGIKENTAAIWANGLRTEALAGLIASQL